MPKKWSGIQDGGDVDYSCDERDDELDRLFVLEKCCKRDEENLNNNVEIMCKVIDSSVIGDEEKSKVSYNQNEVVSINKIKSNNFGKTKRNLNEENVEVVNEKDEIEKFEIKEV